MKDNRKNRKLNYIRLKNKLRLGYTDFKYYEKASYEMKGHLDKKYFKDFIERAKKEMYRKYKLKLPTMRLFPFMYCDDDFIKNLCTNGIALSLK